MSSPSPEQGAAAEGVIASDQESCPSLVALGRRLRQARERRGLDPAVLADRLRLGVEQLRALEEADRQRLPEPVFVFAQARRVAEALKIDVAAELQTLRASGELVLSSRPGSLRCAQAGTAPPRRASAAASARRRDAWSIGIRPSLRRRPTPGRAALRALAGLLGALAALWGVSTLRPSARLGQERMRRQAAGVNVAAPVPPPTPASSAPSAASPAVAPVAPVAAGMVALASREPSWVEVRRPGGALLFRGLLQGGRLFSLAPGLEVMAARPDLVSSRIGAEPARTLGAISEVRWRALPSGR